MTRERASTLLFSSPPLPSPRDPNPIIRSDLIHSLPRLVDQLQSVGAGYLIITIGQNSGHLKQDY